MTKCLPDHSECDCYEPKVRLRYEYREGIMLTDEGMKTSHTVYDTWYDKVRVTLDSKYQCKQFIKRNQEEMELDEQEDIASRPEQNSFRTVVRSKRL